MRLPTVPQTENLGVYALSILVIWGLAVSVGREVFDQLGIAHSYVAHPVAHTVFYLLISGLLVVLYYEKARRIWMRLCPWEYVVNLVPFYILLALFLAWIAHYGPHSLALVYPEVQFLQVGFSYIFPKTGEILFQQIVISLIVMALATRIHSRLTVSLLFAGIFTLAHLPLVLFLETPFVAVLAGGGFVAGLVFPYLILTMRCGIVYTFMLHWLFYVGLITYFWVCV